MSKVHGKNKTNTCSWGRLTSSKRKGVGLYFPTWAITVCIWCLSIKHRWACLLKQQSPIIVYRFLNKQKKLLFSVFICSKPTEVSCFRFPFAVNKGKLPFFISSVFQIYIIIYIRKTELYVYIYICCHFKRKTKNGCPGERFTIYSLCKRQFVICLFVDKETDGSYPCANRLNWLKGLNGLNGVAHLYY